MTVRVALVDGGGTNIGSVRNALDRLGVSSTLTADPAEIRAADRVILPGVGAAAAGMRRLREAGLVDLLGELTQPVLGVCLGMQLLFEHSAEDGGTPCLGLIPGEVLPIPRRDGIRVPHMGWNTLEPVPGVDDPLTRRVGPGERAYFVHSYAVPVGPSTLMTTEHGGTWSAMVRSANRWGAQFHPERSGSLGARLLQDFCREVPS